LTEAIVVMSGGADSCICLFEAINKWGKENIEAITFTYGQRHSREITQAQKICKMNDIPHMVIPLSGWDKIRGSTLLETEGEIKTNEETGLPTSFVPGRNVIFLSYAAAYAYTKDCHNIVTGVCQTDYSGYYDCRNEWKLAMRDTLNMALHGPEISLQWLVGFIEGEGFFSHSYDKDAAGNIKRRYPTFGIEQNDGDVLEKIRNFFGCGWVGQKPSGIWYYRLANKDCQYVRNLMRNNFRSALREQKFHDWEVEFNDYLPSYDGSLFSKAFHGIAIHTPLMWLTKAESIELAIENGAISYLAHTQTCYNNKRPACGVCPACKLRIQGFKEAKIKDPLEYGIDISWEDCAEMVSADNSDIYESPDNGKTIYRRKFGSNERELVEEEKK